LDNPTVTLTADAKKRVVIPGAAPGDVFAFEETTQGLLLKRIYRKPRQKKITKKQALKAIRSWTSLRGLEMGGASQNDSGGMILARRSQRFANWTR
jgi:hypothetical protein